MTQGAHLDSQQGRHDELFLLIKEIVVGQFLADEAVIDLFYALGSFRINEDTVERVQEVVAGGSAYGPFSREPLCATENFLYKKECLARGVGGRIFAELFAQTMQVSKGIAKAIDVINAQAVYGWLCSEAHDEAVRCVEDERIFHANADEIGDGEKTAVVDLLIYVLPVRQHIELLGKQALEGREAGRVA